MSLDIGSTPDFANTGMLIRKTPPSRYCCGPQIPTKTAGR